MKKKIKLLSLLSLLSLFFCSCDVNQSRTFKVRQYWYAWGESHDRAVVRERLHIAEFKDNVEQYSYVVVPLSYHKKYVKVRYTGEEMVYYVEYTEHSTLKKSSNGWVFDGKE